MYIGKVGTSASGTEGRLKARDANRAAQSVPNTVIIQWKIFESESCEVATASACCAKPGLQTANNIMPDRRVRIIFDTPLYTFFHWPLISSNALHTYVTSSTFVII